MWNISVAWNTPSDWKNIASFFMAFSFVIINFKTIWSNPISFKCDVGWIPPNWSCSISADLSFNNAAKKDRKDKRLFVWSPRRRRRGGREDLVVISIVWTGMRLCRCLSKSTDESHSFTVGTRQPIRTKFSTMERFPSKGKYLTSRSGHHQNPIQSHVCFVASLRMNRSSIFCRGKQWLADVVHSLLDVANKYQSYLRIDDS